VIQADAPTSTKPSADADAAEAPVKSAEKHASKSH